jgi:Asp-tRNA(Asn)/Glu-tRNA(Gln) amidotransferase A subunit family amidase
MTAGCTTGASIAWIAGHERHALMHRAGPGSFANERTGVQLLGHVVATLDAIDAANGTLLALLPEEGRRTRLLLEAQALVERWPDAATRPALFGVLVGIKDLLHVDGLPTRAGSALPPAALAGAEGTLVRRLRAQGALILGKTVTAEFAFADAGATCNPHNPGHTPGGSSSGSAALVGAGLLPLAIGTQTVGSVIRPAAYCGAVGYVPSRGRLPLDGLLCVARSVDTLGLFTRDAASMHAVARVLLDGWRDDAGSALPEDAPIHLLVPDGAFMAQVDTEAAGHFEVTLQRLQAAGVTVEVMSIFADLDGIALRHARLVRREFADEHAERFAQWGALYRPGSTQGVREGQAVQADDYAEALASTQQLRARLDIALASRRAVAWLCPAARGAAPAGLWSTGDPAMNMPFSHAGVPAITIPCGRVPVPGGDLPLGLQLVGAFGEDEALLALAERLAALLPSTEQGPGSTPQP